MSSTGGEVAGRPPLQRWRHPVTRLFQEVTVDCLEFDRFELRVEFMLEVGRVRDGPERKSQESGLTYEKVLQPRGTARQAVPA